VAVPGMLLGKKKAMFVWLKDDGSGYGLHLQCCVGCLLFSFLSFFASGTTKIMWMMFY
jgi:hypothetical protein